MAEKNKSSSQYRMVVRFNTDNEAQRQCVNFLGICGYKKNHMIALMTQEFMEKYGLQIDEITNEGIKEFIQSYPYLKKIKENGNNYIPVPVAAVTMPNIPNGAIEQAEQKEPEKTVTTKEHKKNNEKVSKPEVLRSKDTNDFEVDEDMADQVLSVFGL